MWRNSCYPLAVLAGLAIAGPAMARVFPVKDQGEFIQNKATLEKLNELVREIDRRFGKEVLIETFATVPASDVARVKTMNDEARRQYFREEARQRARRNRVNGFYLLANMSPRSLQVLEGNRTEQVFPPEKIREVRTLMLKHFENKDFDGGFVQGLTFIRDELARNPAAQRSAVPVPGGARGEPGVNWGGIICIGLVVLLVIWLVVGLMRGMSGRGGYAGAGGGGGGGFMTGLLGGLFGAMAGNWLYHNMFGGGHGWGSQAYGDSSGTSAGDTDYTGAGGEWGDGGGGGDAGGDWGGGGGGDW